jgi:predicted anti-sigma-YlaC factor YlaD
MGPEQLTCRELVERVTAYLDGALAPAEHAQLEQHLVLCLGCRHHVSQVGGTLRVLHALPAEELTPEALDGLVAAFRAWETTKGAT